MKRLIPSIIKRYAFYFSDYEREITYEGIVFNLDIRHLIDRTFYINKEYEEENFQNLVQVITDESPGYFIDIGACWGIYSLRLAKKFNDLKIKSVEPIKKNVNRIRDSIHKNSLTNIEVYHTAVGDKNGTILLGSNNDWSPNYKINEENIEITEQSQIQTLDGLFNLADQTIVMKIDVEGFEFEALKGAKKILKENKCYLQIEIRYENYDKVEKILNELSYTNESGMRPQLKDHYADCIFKNY
tara:strand:+ start:1559 stop:2287 length:729 start_codon:yes stop_codon:yes gene_type:complete